MIELKAKLGRKGASAPEIALAFIKKYPEIFRVEKDSLARLGAISVATSLCNLNGGAGHGTQGDLFKGFDLPDMLPVRVPDAAGKMRSVNKNFDVMTVSEVAQYLADHDNIVPKQSKRSLEVKRFFESVKDFGDENSTMKQCWDVAQAAGVTKAR